MSVSENICVNFLEKLRKQDFLRYVLTILRLYDTIQSPKAMKGKSISRWASREKTEVRVFTVTVKEAVPEPWPESPCSVFSGQVGVNVFLTLQGNGMAVPAESRASL